MPAVDVHIATSDDPVAPRHDETTGELHPAVDGSGPDDAAAAAVELAGRIADDRRLAVALDAWRQQTTLPYGWGHASLLTGLAGPAVLYRAVARTTGDDRWLGRARGALAAAARSTAEAPLRGPGTDGAGGLLLAVADAAAEDTAYLPSLHVLATRTAEHVAELPRTDPRGQGESAIDVVAGRAGAVVGLVAALRADPDEERVRRAVEDAVADLVRSCPPHAPGPAGHLAVRAGAGEAVDRASLNPHGHVDLGVAHGVPGVLGALAAASSAGLEVPGLADAVRALVDLVLLSAVHDSRGPTWTSTAGTAPDGTLLPADEHPARPGWCYGSPGVAAALASAGRALDDHQVRHEALRALGAEMARGSFDRGLSSPTLCHGTAGMLASALATASSTGADVAREATVRARRALLRSLDPAAPLGVRDEEVPGVRVDNPGLLCGAAGVALVLLDAAAPHDGPLTTARLLALV